MPPLLICTDLDRTLLPNGDATESVGARPAFAQLVSRPQTRLAYVSGRHLALVEEAILDYGLPEPDWIIGDVGSSIYARQTDGWSPLEVWFRHISPDWQRSGWSDLAMALSGVSGLTLQPESRQNSHKLSFFVPLDADLPSLTRDIQARLQERDVAVCLVHSVDEAAAIGLLDILPQRAGKLRAIEFLMREQGLSYQQTIFAGDSGNDLSVLTSSLPAVLVANAHPDVAAQAVAESARMGTQDRLYLARGGFLGMNGNYSSGILEGIGHFHADAVRELE
ncbi:HAD-IIB family hydrolase [Cyanobium gracile]|uniref:HAD-superfamily hydrolase, subfamily IIB n=1 Tax=Cyanobium gracile (strain ATCC 27147 / PCC 6307) TaxID=292564 RepID=K9P613_CYAGP|nr:HAD-IIB family hydrolase [Cyanobium gracile]AFY28161.1 HAD-superfamily hydrolase, subfamily IIB [Cyanobium gracile PCC 6307]